MEDDKYLSAEQYILELEARLARIEQDNKNLKTENKYLTGKAEHFSKAFYGNQTAMAISRLSDGVYCDVNDKYASCMGYSREEMIGKSVLELNIWAELGDRSSMLEQLDRDGFIKDAEFRFRNQQGEIRRSIATLNLVTINNLPHLLTSFIDITKIKETEEKYTQLFYNNQTPMVITRLEDNVCIDVNDKFAAMIEFDREEIIGKTLLQLGIWAEPETRPDIIRIIIQDGCICNVEQKYRKKSGEIRYCISSCSLINMDGCDCIITSSVDISKRKELEEELMASQEKFSKSFYETGTMKAITTLKDGVFIEVNESMAGAFGFSRSEMIGKSPLRLGLTVDPELRQIFKQLSIQKSIKDWEYRLTTKSGEIRYVIANFNLLDLNGEPSILISANDITRQKNLENALRESEQLLNQMFNNIPLPIIISDLKDGTVIEVNETLLNINNLKRKDILGTKGMTGSLWQNPDDFFTYRQSLSQHGQTRNFEARFRTPAGEAADVLLSGVMVNWKGRQCVLTVSNNITELRHYQKEIARLDNLNLMGQMAASIAHEVRNPMTSIKGFLQLFHGQYKYREDREVIDLMIEELDRVNEIISSFLSLAHKNTVDIRRHNLNEQISNLLPLIVADALKNDVYLETQLGLIAEVMIDEGEFRQLLLNLGRNAIQAMPTGGNLTIRTFGNSEGVHLVVQDNGQGITPEIMEKIGTPFLTTKKNGTGLGMAVCFSIAERHNACINIDTGSAGTSFKITFPVVA